MMRLAPARSLPMLLLLLVCGIAALTAPPEAGAKKHPGRKAHGPGAPDFEPPGGMFTSNVTLRLAATQEQPGAVLVYTLDGSEPGPSSPKYTGPVSLTNSTLVRARLIVPGGASGPVRSEDYTLMDEDLRDFGSNLPLVILDTEGVEPSRDHKDPGSLRIVPSHPGRNSLMETAVFEGRALVNIRGRASLRYPKRSYTLKLVDEEGDEKPSSLLGMPRDEDWILYAPYPDKTLMRDVIAYELSRAMGHWAPRTEFVELFVTKGNGRLSRADYAGVYVLEERVKRQPSRVAMQKLSPADVDEPAVTGGYIFKKDHVDRGYYGPPDLLGGGTFTSSGGRNGFPTAPGGFPADPKGFLPTLRSSGRSSRDGQELLSSSSTSRRGTRAVRTTTNSLTAPLPRELERSTRMVFSDDDGTEIVEKMEEGFGTSVMTNQFYWVEPEEDEVTAVQRSWLKGYLDRLEGALYGTNFLDPRAGYRAYLDTASAIDYHMLVEVTKNVDGHRFSTFFTKDRGGRVRFEPVWDWNLSFGNCNGKQGYIPEYWLWPQLTDTEYTWFRRLFEDPDFGQAYVDRWTELRREVFSTPRLLARIDELAVLLGPAQERNFVRWPILGKGVNPNYFVGETYAEEVAWMKDWLQKRLTWIEAQFVAPPHATLTRNADGSAQLAWQAYRGEMVISADGSDPRAPGGGVSSAAVVGPPQSVLPKGAHWMARLRQDGRWSGPLRLDN